MPAGLFAAIGTRFYPNRIDVNGLRRAASGDGGNEVTCRSNEILSGYRSASFTPTVQTDPYPPSLVCSLIPILP